MKWSREKLVKKLHGRGVRDIIQYKLVSLVVAEWCRSNNSKSVIGAEKMINVTVVKQETGKEGNSSLATKKLTVYTKRSPNHIDYCVQRVLRNSLN